MGERFAYRDLRMLAKVGIGFLFVQAALAAFGALSDYWNYQLYGALIDGAMPTAAAAEAADARTGLVALTQMLLYMVGGIVILLWISRANRNAHAIGTLEMETGPGWAVGWFFIPFANLFMPFRVVREIWAASRTAVPGEPEPSMLLLVTWWFAWILGNISGFVALRLVFEHPEAPAMRQTAAGFDVLSNMLTVPACLLLAAIIARIQSIQNRAIQSRAAPSD